ncbi:MAG: 23S rRNA (uridine(2552)-2'-O)-methyltransferase RlmE [Gammaproteobacteria bacterium]|nr:23S rRNA (uridine(2552)-2'-O)-methyltransferase RlmE [Gammaproteobacteria bacterium]MCY3690013.1 23S rRNA (uridine(2552)-2'-O)-methyltransferase RlmE [Gammaproteobacteria bacterium]MDE0479342.1 23S rRNA (uridine(2552)-2'-O)-methyltransferase RlmE [Gammaproteobacteria bacterium]MDE0507640.1 23S rRNA (uridine(2552)-2'-O)-methyltransferase RlmE [Gammaproteobacteria bacterium]MXX05977.1 23S rRNA (uridine(2552)-2'-O)-methyltransferase RlmE [Gammaproteobacteria bacterium]
MNASKSSKRWLQEHLSDPHVKRSREQGYRSRASAKLLEIQRRDRLIRPGMTVVDLGAAPGGWSQVAREAVGAGGKVIAVDLLPMAPIAGVEFVQGDFSEGEVLDRVLERLGGAAADLVISDMAPNMSGMKEVDQPRAMDLAELALDLAQRILAPRGSLLVKVFQGAGCERFRAALKSGFAVVKTRKPDASRARSSEMYLLASGFHGQN